MKVKVTEIRKADFRQPPTGPARFRIDIEYEVYIQGGELGGTLRTFYNKESLEAYLDYLQERKNDYQKVIKEIEI
jgi:hypothetical protein